MTRRPTVRYVRFVTLLLAIALVACSSDDPGEDAAADPEPVQQEDEELEVDEVSDAEAELDPEPEPDEPPPEVEEGPPRVPLGLDPLALDTPASGGGERPDLSWESVAGAARYSVTLYAPDGVAYWAWSGEETSVVVGGIGEPGAEVVDPGPVVRDGMTWDVVAIDGDGRLIAQSGERPIAP